VVTLAEALSGAGYTTAAFVDGGLMARGFGIEQGFESYDDEGGGVAAIGPKVTHWLNEYANRERPFFLFVHTSDVPSPYDSAPEPFRSAFMDEIAAPSAGFQTSHGDALIRVWKGRESNDPPAMSASEIAYLQALYDGNIRYVDHWLGEFIADLKKRGLYESSVLVFLSDHGEEFQDHKGVLHEKLYAEVTRIPLLIKFPGLSDGVIVESVVEAIDLAPTLLSGVGVAPPSDIDGESLLPLIFEPQRETYEIAISESPFYGRSIGIATDRYRLLTSLDRDRTQLFEYRDDPLEQIDVSRAYPKLTAELISSAKTWHVLVGEGQHEGKGSKWLKETIIDQLDELDRQTGLGYLNPEP
jgi:arylsulfatase A-like enzyme